MTDTNPNTQQPPQMPRIKLSDTTAITCECGSEVFAPALGLRKVSAIVSGTGKEEVLPVQAGICCLKCGKKFEPPQVEEQPSSLITPA